MIGDPVKGQAVASSACRDPHRDTSLKVGRCAFSDYWVKSRWIVHRLSIPQSLPLSTRPSARRSSYLEKTSLAVVIAVIALGQPT
jgi:hypothetical protein